MKNCIGYLIFTVGLICKPLLKLPCIPAKIRLHFLILFLFQKGSQHPEMLPHIMTDTAGFIHLRFQFFVMFFLSKQTQFCLFAVYLIGETDFVRF